MHAFPGLSKRRRCRRAYLLYLVAFSVSCSVTTTAPGRSVVLSPAQTQMLLSPCSRNAPQGVEATWIVPQEVVDQLEANLYKLARLRADQCCILRGRIRYPGTYFRQYVGIVIGNRRLVYINAFRSASDKAEWRSEAVVACDGGDDYWGAVYDPETKVFSNLAINGLA